MTSIEGIKVVLWLIAEDMYNDATGVNEPGPVKVRVVAETLGQLQAAVLALAAMSARMLELIEVPEWHPHPEPGMEP